MTEIIDNIAFIYIRHSDHKILMTLSKGKLTWYIPAGKRENGESDIETLIREVKEELSVNINPSTVKYYGVFTAQAHGKQEGILVKMTCYTAEFDGTLKANNEIAKIDFLSYAHRDKVAQVSQLIFDDLKEKGILE